MEQRPGRNDPCWCGSGKKYKNCHMREDQVKDSHDLIKRNLIERLDEYALDRTLKNDFTSAYKFFLEREFAVPQREEDMLDFQRALDYFVYDYRLSDGRRVVERFADEIGPRLAVEQRVLLQDWKDAVLSAYEITAVERGVGMHLREIVTGEEIQVSEKTGTLQTGRWEIVMTRFLRDQDLYESAGLVLHFPPIFRDELRNFIEHEWNEYESAHSEATYEEFLHASSQLLNHYVQNEIIPALTAPPTMLTAEGDLAEYRRALFDVRDYDAALQGLNAAEEFADQTEKGGAKEFIWHEKGISLELLRVHGPDFKHKDPAAADRGEVRILGNISLTPTELTLDATSQRRLDAGKELLARRLGGSIQHRSDETQSMEQMLTKLPLADDEEPLDLNTSAAADEKEPFDLNASVEAEAVKAEIAAAYHRGWLDQEIPLLDGQTPRAAVKTFSGRVRVIRLLKQIEASEHARERAGVSEYPLGETAQELGLSDQEFLDESRLEDRMKDDIEEIENLALNQSADEALAAWHAMRTRYPFTSIQELDFAEVWDLAEILEETEQTVANRLATLQRYDEGIAFLLEYLALEPEDADTVRADMAEMRAERGETERALQELHAMLKEAAGNYAAADTLANLQRDLLDRPQEALETRLHAREHMDEDWLDDFADEILDLYRQLGRLDEAEQFWHHVNDDAEKKEYRDLVEIQLARGDFEHARETANKIEDKPGHDFWLGMVEAQAGHLDAARTLWARTLQLPSIENWPFWFLWTELHLRLREFGAVIEKMDPIKLEATPLGYFDLALAYAGKGDLAHAAEWAQAARAEMERRMRRSHRAMIWREVRELADLLHLDEPARQALGI